jgi:hypothetical protein
MLRVSAATRDRVLRLAADDFGGVSADEALARLLDEHWEAQAIAAMDRYRATDPSGWTDYLSDADQYDRAAAAAVDAWAE